MCIPIGIEFACGCEWLAWIDCDNATTGVCTIKARCPNNLPLNPAHGGAKYSLPWKYVGLMKEHMFIVKVTDCCGPECCQRLLNLIANTNPTPQQYQFEAGKHTTFCGERHANGLGMLNCMRLDMGQAAVAGQPFTLHPNLVAGFIMPFAEAAEYIELFNAGRGLQSNRFAACTSVEQYLAIRTDALSDPAKKMPKSWSVTNHLNNTFKDLQSTYGKESRHAAQLWFQSDSGTRIVAILYAIVNPDVTVKAAEVTAPTQLPAVLPAAAQPRAPAELEKFRDVEDAAYDIYARASAVVDLPWGYQDQVENFYSTVLTYRDIMAHRKAQLMPLKDELRELENAVNAGNRLDCDRALLMQRLHEAWQLIDFKLSPPKKPAPPAPALTGAQTEVAVHEALSQIQAMDEEYPLPHPYYDQASGRRGRSDRSTKQKPATQSRDSSSQRPRKPSPPSAIPTTSMPALPKPKSKQISSPYGSSDAGSNNSSKVSIHSNKSVKSTGSKGKGDSRPVDSIGGKSTCLSRLRRTR